MKLTAIFAGIVVAAVALGTTAVLASQNPIAERQELMKANGHEAKLGAAMAKGEKPFELAAAKKVFATFEKSAEKMPGLFPPDSKTGHKTTAGPKIWKDMAGFKARFEKLGADAKKAQVSVTDLANFKTAFAGIGRQCGGCHHEYRIKRD